MDDAWEERAREILGDISNLTFGEGVERFCSYLRQHLKLPCEVTGSEDFDWEEYYVIGPGRAREYQRLRRTQPSFQDTYDLLRIEFGPSSEWMLYPGEDIAAFVRRQSDGREFCLGLAELEAKGTDSANYRLLDDYAVWFVNSR